MGDARLAHAARSGPSPMKKGRCGGRRVRDGPVVVVGGRRWTTSQSLGLVNGCRMSMKKIGKRRGSIRRGLVTARTSYFLLPTVHLTYTLVQMWTSSPSFIRTAILVSGTSLAATRKFLHEMRGMRARKLITPRVEDEAAHHLPTVPAYTVLCCMHQVGASLAVWSMEMSSEGVIILLWSCQRTGRYCRVPTCSED